MAKKKKAAKSATKAKAAKKSAAKKPAKQAAGKAAQGPQHPGQILLLKYLRPKKIKQADFARAIGWPQGRLSELINGKRHVTIKTALLLEKASKISAREWALLQVDWELAQERKRSRRR